MILPSDERDPSAVDPGDDGENELVEKILPGTTKEENCELGIYEIAKKRFNLDPEYERAKLKMELDQIHNEPEINPLIDD